MNELLEDGRKTRSGAKVLRSCCSAKLVS